MGKIDLTYLENITDGENEIMVEMIDLMLDETPKHFKNLNKALEAENWSDLSSESHKLKPMFLYVGLTELSEISKDLENYGKHARNLEAIPELIEKLEAGFNEVVPDLKEKKAQLS
jgi:HPt (histidine-containing phosphotransfer) domain-containing protein